MHGGERLIPTARRASTWASASVIILSTAFLSPCNESMRCLPMNYGDVAMEAGVAVVAARAAPGGTRVALVRRSATEVELLCNALRARPAGQPGLFIDVPGLIYGPSARGREQMELSLRAVTCARDAGLRTMMEPASFYDFAPGDVEARMLAARLFARFDYAMARDAHAQDVARSLLGDSRLGAPLLPRGPDCAFLFEHESLAAVAFLERHVASRLRPIVTVEFNRRAFSAWPTNTYPRAYKAALHAAIEIYGKGQVVLIAHERRRYKNDRDDRYWTHRTAVAHNLSTTVEFTLPADPPLHGADEELAYIKKVDSVIARASLHIASRYHSAVAALRAGVPILCMSWHSKFEGLLRGHGCIDQRDVPSLLVTQEDSVTAIRAKVERAPMLFGTRECRLRYAVDVRRVAAEAIREQMAAAGLRVD